MALLLDSYQSKLVFLTIIAALMVVENVAASSLEDNGYKSEENGKTAPLNYTEPEKQQKTFKKDLKVNLTALNLEPVTVQLETNDQTEKLVIKGEKSVIETAGKAGEQQLIGEQTTPVAQKGVEKTNLLIPSTNHPLSTTKVNERYHKEEQFLIKSDSNDVPESLKTGFYFFLILSSGAIIFITFKIYRLRLSRAERKYGVHGDRTAQELTPLPVSIEDGHSDDEDQTLFEVQRQNIRIL